MLFLRDIIGDPLFFRVVIPIVNRKQKPLIGNDLGIGVENVPRHFAALWHTDGVQRHAN